MLLVRQLGVFFDSEIAITYSQDDPEAHEKFVKITRAYEVLKDPQQRKQYDLFGEDAKASSWSQSQYHSYTYYRDHFGIYDDDPQIITLNTADFGMLTGFLFCT